MAKHKAQVYNDNYDYEGNRRPGIKLTKPWAVTRPGEDAVYFATVEQARKYALLGNQSQLLASLYKYLKDGEGPLGGDQTDYALAE